MTEIPLVIEIASIFSAALLIIPLPPFPHCMGQRWEGVGRVEGYLVLFISVVITDTKLFSDIYFYG